MIIQLHPIKNIPDYEDNIHNWADINCNKNWKSPFAILSFSRCFLNISLWLWQLQLKPRQKSSEKETQFAILVLGSPLFRADKIPVFFQVFYLQVRVGTLSLDNE